MRFRNFLQPEVRLRSIVLLQLFIAMSAVGFSQAQHEGGSFDAQRAFKDLVEQVSYGPRLPASDATKKTRQLILRVLKESGFQTGEQPFSAYSQLQGRTVAGENIYGILPAGGSPYYMISAHYDTRPFADQDPDPSHRQTPIPGANDGGSGVAVLLEVARCLALKGPSKPVALVFFDLEDHGTRSDETGFCLGARYFAEHLPREVAGFKRGVNLDMIGQAGLKLGMEMRSANEAPEVAGDIWTVGQTLYPSIFIDQSIPAVYDDHVPFLASGHSYIDLIDFNYPPWHTLGDTPDKCSPDSLKAVGDTVLAVLRR